MDKAKQRKIEAREHRQESLKGITANVNIIKFPQPKELQKNEKVFVDNHDITDIKRGRGRPRKLISDNNKNKSETEKGNKKPTGSKGKSNGK
jgi:hypothetical protein